MWGAEVTIDMEKSTFPADSDVAMIEEYFPNLEHGWFSSTTGEKLHYRKCLPSNGEVVKGIFVCQHGISGHAGISYKLLDGTSTKYDLLDKSLVEAGFAFYALDMLHHGLSEGLRFHVPGWKVNRGDLD